MASKNRNSKKEKSSLKSFHDELLIKPAEEIEALDIKGEKVTLDVIEKGRRRRMEFISEEDKKGWKKAYRKRKLYTPYFLVGVAVNALLYHLGLDLAADIFWGLAVGVGVPFLFMFFLAEVHYRIFMGKYDSV